jgi:hypothetical protein
MSARKFLKPLSVLIATILGSTTSNSAEGKALIEKALDGNSNPEPISSVEGRPDPEQIVLDPSSDGMINLGHHSHSSHASHASHRSHYSGY